MKREAGFVETVEEKYPGIEIVGLKFNMADRAKALAEGRELDDSPSRSRRFLCRQRGRA